MRGREPTRPADSGQQFQRQQGCGDAEQLGADGEQRVFGVVECLRLAEVEFLGFEDVVEQLQALRHQLPQPGLLSRRLPRLELAVEVGDCGLHIAESARLGPMRQTARILAGEPCPALRLLLPQAVEIWHRFQLLEQYRPQFGAELTGLEGIARIAIVGLHPLGQALHPRPVFVEAIELRDQRVDGLAKLDAVLRPAHKLIDWR